MEFESPLFKPRRNAAERDPNLACLIPIGGSSDDGSILPCKFVEILPRSSTECSLISARFARNWTM